MKRPIAMIWAEGFLDRIAAQRLVVALRLRVTGSIQDAGGAPSFWKLLRKYNQAAKQCGLVFALADHDSVGCVGPSLANRLPDRHPNLILRLCVAELEAWLLADADRLGEFLRVSPTRIPIAPDRELDPKRTLVQIASKSTKPSIREGMVPKVGHSSIQGPEYSLLMEEFIREKWAPLDAARRSPSLARAISALKAACISRSR